MKQPLRRLAVVAALCATMLHSVVTDVPGASAYFSDSAPWGEDFEAAALQPPTDLAIVSAAGVSNLSWTPSTSTSATGVDVLRGTTIGGPYVLIASLGAAVTTYTDSPGTGSFYYVTRTTQSNWQSTYSNEVNTVFTALSTAWFPCTAQAADTGGDGNGYETNSAAACGDDGIAAEDLTTGTGTSTSCTSTAKDKHRFSNFNLVLPTVATIRGVEVRTQSWLKPGSATTGTQKLCVQISTDGGTTWTTPLSTSGLTNAEKVFTFGSTSNLWSRTWLPTQFTNALFVVRVVDVAKALTKSFSIDDVQVRVTYSCPCV